MVKIKYNNMKISKKPTPPQQQPFRRKLRSSSKQSPHDSHAAGTSSDEKVIQQSFKQFDNQQSINGTKSTGPIQDEIKIGVFESALFCMRTRRTRYDDLPKNKHEDVVRESATKVILQEVVQTIVTPIVEEIKPEPLQQKQKPEEFVTPVKQQSQNLRCEQKLILRESRRSGRRQKRSRVSQIPFRKFQDSFEQKIVVLINRIYQKKGNEKDIEMLAQKLHKMSLKELYNPYVISGVQTVLNLIERGNLCKNNHQVVRLGQQLKKVSTRIWEELGKVQDYENIQMQECNFNLDEFKPKFIRKIYKILLHTYQFSLKEAKQKSFHISEAFFSNSNNYLRQDDLLSFFKQQKFLAY